jgi:RNA polymerase primary sigma factor
MNAEKDTTSGRAHAPPEDAFATRRPRAPRPDLLRKLDEDDGACLLKLIEEPTGYIDHPTLHQSGATKKLFGVSARLQPGNPARFAEPPQVGGNRSAGGPRMPTLTTEEEHLLFLRINLARKRIEDLLAAHHDQHLDLATARKLVAWARWELATRERIVELNMPLVLAMAKRTRLVGIDFAEMTSEGNMALLRSVDKFDCGRGFKFSTYACRAILKSFSRVAMRTSRYRSTFPVEFDPTIEKSDHLERRREEHKADCVDDLKQIMARNVAALTDVEAEVIRHRFALEAVNGEPPLPKTLEQVGQIIGVTKERVRQIQNKALKKIRHALEETYLAA